jgi:hypothetical protein
MDDITEAAAPSVVVGLLVVRIPGHRTSFMCRVQFVLANLALIGNQEAGRLTSINISRPWGT